MELKLLKISGLVKCNPEEIAASKSNSDGLYLTKLKKEILRGVHPGRAKKPKGSG
jgi:hypothetical protein